MSQSRRKFIETLAIAGASLPFARSLGSTQGEGPGSKLQVRLFSKPLDKYDFDFMCECLEKSGIEGFDLTVRKGGKIEPENVERELPELIEKARKHNLAIDMIVTDITSASDPYAENVLKTASAEGVKYYRLGWLDYSDKIEVWETLQNYKSQFKDLSELNRKYSIHGGYQNHAGKYIGAPVWDLHEILKDLPAEYIGSQYDVRHGMVEGADTWILGMRLISKHIKTLAVKDYTWKNVNGKPTTITVPLGEGMVRWDQYFQTVKDYNISGPITLHVEYDLLNKEEEKLSLAGQQDIIVRKLRKDMAFLSDCLQKYNLD
jgi:L-ribulose-5-phosphate 3-epimerase